MYDSENSMHDLQILLLVKLRAENQTSHNNQYLWMGK